ncbi:MAG: DNA repair protein RecO [Acidimicrobiia bacterium]
MGRYPPVPDQERDTLAIRNDQGIVLRGYPFGESHRVVVILSPNNGKLRTVAKGVRKTKSRFGGRLEPLTHVDLILYEGKNLDTITQVSIINAFPHLRNDLDRVLAAGTMVEIVDAVVQEDEPSQRMFLLLQRGLTVLDHGPPHPDLVTAFLLKAAAIIGVAPSLDSCAGCGATADLRRFSFAAGGSLCEGCRTPGSYVLREGLVPYLATVAAAELHVLPDADPSFSKEGLGVTRRFMEYHLERQIDSLAVLND